MGKASRQAFGESLALLGEKHPEIVVLDADLAKSTKSEIFAKRYPDRFFEMGISEANMIGTAAGLALAGKIPFACSFGCFLTGRYDVIRLSVAYSQANVRLVGTHAGVGIGDDGHSQMGLEDIALMRALPKMGVFQPADARETELLMKFLVADWKGPAYLRLTRQNLDDVVTADCVRDADYDPLKLLQVKATQKPKIMILATGGVVGEAVKASTALQSSGVLASVWNVCSLKPFDHTTLLEHIAGVDWVVTAEDHSVMGGLGSIVAEVLSTRATTARPRQLMLGIQDEFGESGEGPELYEKFGISANRIAQSIRELM